MPRNITVLDLEGNERNLVVATLYYDRLAQADSNFVVTVDPDSPTFVTTDELDTPGVVYRNERVRPQEQNLQFYVFSAPGLSPGAAESEYLNASLADVIKPDDDINNRIIDFVDFSTGQRLHAGDDFSRCFSSGESYSTPPADITTSKAYWKRYGGGGYPIYYERTNQWNNPSDVFYRNYSLVNYVQTNGGYQADHNILGCSVYCYNGAFVISTGFDPKGFQDHSWSSQNVDLCAYVTNDKERSQYANVFDYDWFGALSGGWSPDSPDVDRAPIHNYLASVNNPYTYGDVSTDEPKVLDELSVQFVYTEIESKPYIGLMLLRFDDAGNVVAMNGSFYPAWIFGTIGGEGGDPDEPDPGEEDYGPDAEQDNAEGDYTITQDPPGAVNAESSWLPYSDIGANDGGGHVYVIDTTSQKALFADFWGSHLDTDKLASGIVRFGAIPNAFYPLSGATTVSGLSYGSYAINLPDSANAWLINDRIINKVGLIAVFDETTGLNRVYGNYLDYEPYTNIVLNVPFCGSMEIPPSKCIGGKIEVSVTVNCENGDMIAQVRCTSNDRIKTSRSSGQALTTDYYLRGNCFVDYPIAVTPNTGLQVLKASSKAVVDIAASAANLMAGNAYVAGAKMADSMADLINIGESTKASAKSIGGQVNGNLLEPKKVYIEVTRPAELADGKYKKISGTPSFKAKKLDDIKGFTQCLQVLRTTISTEDGVTTNTQQLTFSGSPSELSEIKRVLQEGVVL